MKRITFIAIAALAAGALVAPSSALAGKSHFLGTYKVEKHLDIEGEDGTYTISCDPGDIALDGMWRIDNVDQDNDYVYTSNLTSNPLYPQPGAPSTWNHAWEVLKSVELKYAYATSIGTYEFKFVPQAGADAQGKLFLVCLPGKVTQTAGHQNQWDYTFNGTDTPTTCNSGTEIAIQPGLNFTANSGHWIARWPSGPTHAPNAWTVATLDGADGVATSAPHWSCLKIKSQAAGSPAHSHRLVAKWMDTNDPSPPAPAPPPSGPTSGRAAAPLRRALQGRHRGVEHLRQLPRVVAGHGPAAEDPRLQVPQPGHRAARRGARSPVLQGPAPRRTSRRPATVPMPPERAASVVSGPYDIRPRSGRFTSRWRTVVIALGGVGWKEPPEIMRHQRTERPRTRRAGHSARADPARHRARGPRPQDL